MPESLYARPSADVIGDATLSWAVASADADYPITNAATEDPEEVAKANATTATLRATFGAPVQLLGVIAIHTNWPGLTVPLTNNGGMASQGRVVVDPEDELGINVYWDLRTVAGNTAAQWNIAVTGAPTNVAIGRLLLLTSWGLLRSEWRYRNGERHVIIEHRTGHQKRKTYWTGNRMRSLLYTPNHAEDVAALQSLRRETRGPLTPFPVVPDTAEPDVLLVQFSKEQVDATFEYYEGQFSNGSARGKVTQPFEVEEVSAGVPL